MENIIKDLNDQILEFRSKNLNLEVEIAHKDREIHVHDAETSEHKEELVDNFEPFEKKITVKLKSII